MLPIDKRIGPNRLLTDKDLASFYYVTNLLAKQDKGNFVYVGLGRSPALLMEFMRQAFGLRTLDLPLGGMSSGGEAELTEPVLAFLEKFLPPDAIAGKTLVLVDYAYSGSSMKVAQRLLQAYINKRLDGRDDTLVRIAPITHKKNLLTHDDSLLQEFDVDTRVAHRLIKVLFTEVDKEYYSPYTSVKYAELARASQIPQNIDQIRERQNLSEMMQLALQYYGEHYDPNIHSLARSPHMQKRKGQNKAFSYASFKFGYTPIQEEGWVRGLHDKAAGFYNVRPEIVLPPLVTQKATEYRRQLRRRELERKCKTYAKGTVNLAFTLLVLYSIWYLYKLLAPTGPAAEL